ncbi:MAG: pseudouridine synthase [Bacteroidales bacterium]|nr:pseudouridine synthase [Bacteroidales bacterium]
MSNGSIPSEPHSENFGILYQDDFLTAMNKAAGMMVHRSEAAGKHENFALQQMRNHLGRWVFTVHRLDRKTSGVLLFALDKETQRKLQGSFSRQEITKTYHAVVRGYTPDESLIDYPLVNEVGKLQDAITQFRTLTRAEVNLPFGKFQTSRYSLIEILPKTGRMHQIRRHLAHINHPIIGDRPHGCNKQNKLFKEKWNMVSMLLHASSIEFEHPFTKEKVKISAPFPPEFNRILILTGLQTA